MLPTAEWMQTILEYALKYLIHPICLKTYIFLLVVVSNHAERFGFICQGFEKYVSLCTRSSTMEVNGIVCVVLTALKNYIYF